MLFWKEETDSVSRNDMPRKLSKAVQFFLMPTACKLLMEITACEEIEIN
jgi:hypothetical protein